MIEILLGACLVVLLGAWASIVYELRRAVGEPAPYFPDAAHLAVQNQCGHEGPPHVVYPGGFTSCKKCHQAHTSG